MSAPTVDEPKPFEPVVVEPPRLMYTLLDAAKLLSISRTRMYGLMRADAIPSVLLGGTRFFAYDDLVEFVQKLRAEALPYAETAS